MHLVTFSDSSTTRIGVLDRLSNEIIDVSQITGVSDMNALIDQGPNGLMKLQSTVAAGAYRIPLAKVKVLAPIPIPKRNILCVGKNYRDHVHEVETMFPGRSVEGMPEVPIFFTKATTAVIGEGEMIPVTSDPTNSADYEGELAIVLSKGGRGISRQDAMSHIFGYTIINDVSSRRLQKSHQQWFLGKSLDGFCPMGPSIVTQDEIDNVHSLVIETRVNGELRQREKVNQMIFDIPTQIEVLSRTMTLIAGDIIATGTPAGVGMGFNPPRFLQAGDEVAITIEPIGTLVNPVK